MGTKSLSNEERKKRKALVNRVVIDAGGVASVKQKLGISRQAVELWSRIPAEHVLKLEEICTKYDRHYMRPDVFGKFPGQHGKSA